MGEDNNANREYGTITVNIVQLDSFTTFTDGLFFDQWESHVQLLGDFDHNIDLDALYIYSRVQASRGAWASIRNIYMPIINLKVKSLCKMVTTYLTADKAFARMVNASTYISVVNNCSSILPGLASPIVHVLPSQHF